jgi:nucleotide-binding universal stress UspA family protein
MEQTTHEAPFAESILHPSNFSDESERAFAHALAITLQGKASLTILNVGAAGRGHTWTEFPSVRGTLGRWGLLGAESSRASVFRDLDVRVKKVSLKSRRPLTAVLDYLEQHPADLIVLATEGRGGLPRWIRPSLAEAIARRSETKVLFVPRSARSLVSPEDGRMMIERILVPVDHHPDPRAAVLNAARVAAMSVKTPVSAVALYVGPPGGSPKIAFPESRFCAWSEINASGDVVDAIIHAAAEPSADLIVMATERHGGILDALRGSVTEQVLRRAPCPVLAVPARRGGD